MNVISNDDLLADVFTNIYQDLLKRNPMPYPLVYQNYGTVWNLSTLNSDHSVNLGETRRNGQQMVFLQARKPPADDVVAGEKHLFLPDDTVKMSYIVAYYLLITRGPVEMPKLNRQYEDLSHGERIKLGEVMTALDRYLAGG